MSSGFVSAGGGDEYQPPERSEEWAKVHREVAAARQSQPESGKQEGGNSLYEHLQANKAKKQDAFEEASKLRNQFRSLDDDEIDFLDSVLESTRARDAEVKKETLVQLNAFRKHREEAEKVAVDEPLPEEGAGLEASSWSSGPRKRKKGKEVFPGVKLRRTSSSLPSETRDEPKPASTHKSAQEAEHSPPSAMEGSPGEAKDATPRPLAPPPTRAASDKPSSPPPKKAVGGLGLGGYSSDEDN